MARIRTIKPELLEDEKVARLPHLQWRLFVSCLLLADDYGNFRADPERIRGAVLWAFRTENIDRAVDGLVATGLLVRYLVAGQSYAHVIGWGKHQKVDHPGKPSCPPWVPSGDDTVATSSREPRDSVAPDLKGSDQDRIGPGPGRDSDEPAGTPTSSPTVPPSLASFPCVGSGSKTWDLTEKQQAEWGKLFPGVDVPRELRAALAWCQANTAKRKTARGMPAFIVRWLTTSQNRGAGNGFGSAPRESRTSGNVKAGLDWLAAKESA